ncbi:MAG: hypothetical protein ABFS86_00615 [Planctomycetota bacterium]
MDEGSPGENPPARDLLRELRESARGLGRLSPEERERLLADRQDLRQRISGLPWEADTGETLREHLSHVGTRLEQIEGLTAGQKMIGLEILELRGDLIWLPLSLPEDPRGETRAALEAELGALRAAGESLEEMDGGDLLERIAGVESGIADVNVSLLTRHVEELDGSGDSTLAEYWCAFLEAREVEIAGRDLADLTRSLRRRIQERAESEPPVMVADDLARCAAELESRALDLLAVQSDLDPEHAANMLALGRKELAWLRDLLRATIEKLDRKHEGQRTARKDLGRWSRRLRRAHRRLTSEAQEVSLQVRLEGIFGARFVAFFENLILWLIVGVLVLLVVDAFLPWPDPPIPKTVETVNRLVPWLDPPFAVAPAEVQRAADWTKVHHFLAWVDLGICLVFLLEFFTKLALVHGRGRWFLRHFLVDLVPSIPLPFLALRAGRLGRFLRLPRLIRYVRIARPLTRFFRFFGFLQRGVDRMMRMHGQLINQNIVLFEPVPLAAEEEETEVVVHRLRELRVLARQAWRRHSDSIPAAIRSRRLNTFVDRLPAPERLLSLPAGVETHAPDQDRVLRAEELIDRLTSLDPGTVEAELGLRGADRLATTLTRLDVPVLRLLPGIRQMVRAARDGKSLQRVTAAGKALGRWLGRFLTAAFWISDLSGVVSGPQFLDRLGSALVKATARPAKRLLMFGFGFLVLQMLVRLLGFTALLGIVSWLERTLGVTFLVLGFSCLALMLLGMWFRRVAGEATDFYTRTAEAQYINLLKSAKLAYLDEDLDTLWERALRPEQLLGGEVTEGGSKLLRDRFVAMQTTAGEQTWSDKVIRLYRDYLDGALFHSSDTKTSSQLLGNLSLEDIRRDRLGTWRSDRKRLGRLDLYRTRSAVRGPYFWFHSINHSVAQWTAKLILEYNRHAIPLTERGAYTEEEVAACDAWLDKKISGDVFEPEDVGEVTAFRTTQFTALHILTADPERDERVQRRFGERTLEALRIDRRAMIRTVFGTHPFHRLPRTDRTLNPFDIYHRYLAGGRGILVPLYLLRAVLKALSLTIRRVRETLREILSTTTVERDAQENWASYDVAVRKINRMRRPLFMECARFRSRFDPEYLGLSLFPERESGLEGRTFREDLERIGARDWEWDEFVEIREERAASLLRFRALVEENGGPQEFAKGIASSGAANWREAYRAAAIAFAIDYQDVSTLSRLRARSTELIEEVIAAKGRVPGTELLPRFLRNFLPRKSLKMAWAEFRLRYGWDRLEGRELRWVWQAIRADHGGLRRLVRIGASLEPGTSPEQAAREAMKRAALHPDTWSEQLVTLRIVQSLSVLDIRNYRRQVYLLGGYGNG